MPSDRRVPDNCVDVALAALLASIVLAVAAFAVERSRDRASRRREFVVDRLLESYRALANTTGELGPREKEVMAAALNDLQVFGSRELIVAVKQATANAEGVHEITAVVEAVRHQLREELGLKRIDLPFTNYRP
jgi:hypothetical protein